MIINLLILTLSLYYMVNGTQGFFLREMRPPSRWPSIPFFIHMEYFSRLLNLCTSVDFFNYHPKCGNIKITHLTFADDVLLFARGDMMSVRVLSDALVEFEEALGLAISPMKSSIFYAGLEGDRAQVLGRVGFSKGQLPVRYLGAPLAASTVQV